MIIMFKMKQIIMLSLLIVMIQSVPLAQNNANRLLENAYTEEEMKQIFETYLTDVRALCTPLTEASWNFQTHIGEAEYTEVLNTLSLGYANYERNFYETYIRDVNATEYQDESLRRQIMMLKDIGTSSLSDADLSELNRVQNEMEEIYTSAKICSFSQKDNCQPASQILSLEPEIEEIMATSQNYEELEYVWAEWRKKTGDLMKDDYVTYVDLMNKAATENGYSDAGEMWRSSYEDDDFMNTIDRLWDQVQPLYDELHTYVRYKLLDIYGDHMDKNSDMIPAHLLGNMWGQSWVNLYDRIKPYKDASLVDVTETLKSKYSIEQMFIDSDNFYKSMGLPSSAMSYGPKAIIEKPTDRTITCHASAWDFCDGEDFRIKMCTNLDMEDYVTVHHEMGHIMYFLLYKDQPISYQTGATPAFHEAIGDTIALSVSTPKHLQKIGLLENYADSEEDNINSLFSMALERVAFLPFGLLIDKWRWQVFNGDIPQNQWNEKWWELREKYQKISAPVPRTAENFDPGAKYHVPASSQYIAYFVAHILEFQFYRSLCVEAGEYNPANPGADPLHKCDFYESVAAGNKLRSGLSLGASKHWTEVMTALTGSSEISAQPLLEYFDPLYKFLQEENKKLAPDMKEILDEYNVQASQYCNRNNLAEWDVQTNIGDAAKVAELNKQSVEYANYMKVQYDTHFKNANLDDYEDLSIRRQISMLRDLGTSALSDEDLTQLNTIQSGMEQVYTSAKICPFDKRNNCQPADEILTLEPEIEEIMSTSENYEELEYVWAEWRRKTGDLMRSDYLTYVGLMNKAATENGYSDAGEMWRSRYEDDDFMNTIDRLWDQVQPLYDELHTYVRYKLLDIYGDHMDKNSEMIPAHLLGNMWGQSWVNLYDRIKPYKDASLVDVTEALKSKYSIQQMFSESDNFYKSMGLPSSEMSYGPKAIIEKPTDRTITCHASAWDFCDGEDFRIKMCTNLDMEDYVTVHHEMGHIMYYLLYKDQPLSYRTGATPAFHEAVGDTIALSVSTPKHLQKIGLLENYADSAEDNINSLFSMALERVAFLPFGLLIDKWRWQVFNGDIPQNQWNEKWWELREQYQKLSAPVPRTAENFDPGAKYHVPASSQYIAYFVAHILEFQFYRSLCVEAGEYNPANPGASPLHKCDFFESEAAGNKLRSGLSLGASKHWTEAMTALTGSPEISAQPLLEYFDPLYKFLQEENKKLAPDMGEVLVEYNVQASQYCNRNSLANWDVQTNIGDAAKLEEQNKRSVEYANYRKAQYDTHFKDANLNDYEDLSIRRQISMIRELGTSALSDEDLTHLNTVQRGMEQVYNSARICPFDKRNNCQPADEILTLEPEIEGIMSTSENYEELEYVWAEWRRKTGNLMKSDYLTYVGLMNKAATENGYSDAGEMWRSRYEDDDFMNTVDKLWDQVQPLYDELHTYVRHKLLDLYGDHMDKDSDMIPAHLLGNMWGQSWVNLYDRIKPYKDASLVDVTDALKSKYSIEQMFIDSDNFYKSMGLPSSAMSYGPKAIIEKPTDRTITCHASAWDFCDGEDFRIKMCTNLDMEDYVTVHHEMGHIIYDLMYKDQPISYRTGATPAFHEAIGDTIALSVSTPKHLQKIGLLENYADSEEDNINSLFSMALERVAFLPFGLLIDKWRWQVFNGDIPQNQWNEKWWELREKYQKISAPVPRTAENFDPGAKYHVPASSQYIAYFVAHILEFQFYRSLCIEAGQYNPANPGASPLHKCDFYESVAAGNKLRSGLSLGASKHWSEAMTALTGSPVISAQPLLEYFDPLYKFLKEENENYDSGFAIRMQSTIAAIPLALTLCYLFTKYFTSSI